MALGKKIVRAHEALLISVVDPERVYFKCLYLRNRNILKCLLIFYNAFTEILFEDDNGNNNISHFANKDSIYFP